MAQLPPRARPVVLHLSFWAVYFSFYFYQFGREFAWPRVLLLLLASLGLNAALAYLHYLWLLPRLLRTRRVAEYLALLAGPFAAVVALRVVVDQRLLATPGSQGYLHSAAHAWAVALGTLFIGAFVAMLYFATHWFALEARARALEHENLTAELRYLKAQLNPHFLFNTLNNLYYLAYSQSARTPEVVATLAQLMRYLLDEASHPAVPLTRDIEYLASYVELEKLRLNHPVPISLTVSGEPAHLVVAPLLFMAFVENAFKHGISTASTPAEAWIRIHFELTPTSCRCRVANSKLPVAAPATPAAPTASAPLGTGLPNVRRRLALSYPGRHELRLEDLPTEYRVDLLLTL